MCTKNFALPFLVAFLLCSIDAHAEDRYTVTPCGSIIDGKNRLEWFVGHDQATDWNQASEWARRLSTCNGGWRMPSLTELKTLYEPNSRTGKGWVFQGVIIEPHLNAVFKGIGGGTEIWTDRSSKEQSVAMLFDFSSGIEKNRPILYAIRVRAFAVRAVTGEPDKKVETEKPS